MISQVDILIVFTSVEHPLAIQYKQTKGRQASVKATSPAEKTVDLKLRHMSPVRRG